MPDKIIDVADVLLVWLRGQESFEEPPAIVDLVDVAELYKQPDALAHDGDFAQSVVDLLEADGASITYVNQADEVFNWDKLPLVVKKRTSTSAIIDKPYCKRWGRGAKVELLSKFGTVARLVVIQ
jgi:hypothetical protein